ncbi:peptidoglycan D,D-transpeptidase FtsI family protein [Fontivita pretiosa]|uniref:peptidoglycan D,D-transpeptidase FtsI family protein n=1 Tax=Fontivita pretiosa TaxID=2989684 RepID=UPI003D186A47
MHRFCAIRATVAIALIAGSMLVLLGRVGYLQTYGREQTIQKAERQQHQTEVLYARRGSIFDSTGLLMAGTVQTLSLFIDPKFMQDEFQADGRSLVDMDKALEQLAKLIDADPFELAKLLGDRYTSRFIRVADNLDEQTCQQIERMKLPGVGLTPMNVRYYPMGSIAAHVLGGVGAEGVGLEGLELKYEKLLAGRNGYKRTLKDARRRAIAVSAEDYLPPQNGQHLILTIDANIQMIAEQELAAACQQFSAKAGEVVVMDPNSGQVLALANYPTFNPQNLEDSTKEIRRNRCLTDPFEPGSTLKPFIVGPALAWKLTRINEVFPIHGPHYKSSLRAKLVTDVHPYESLATWDVLVKSSNIGMTMIGERLGKQRVYEALRSWRLGQQTGIELPGEDPGMLKPLRQWGNSDVVSAVQGYSVLVTPLQLARGMCAYANGGRLVPVRLVRGVLDENGSVVSRWPAPELKDMPQVLDEATAAQVRRILADVPVRGTATRARSRHWNIFGKTGTAHLSRGGGYNDQSYTSSFIGGAPYENPRLVIAMIIHEPDRSKAHYGGTVSAPAAARALERALAYLQIPASPDLPPPPPQIASVLYAFDPKLYAPRSSLPPRTASAAQD